MQATKIQVTTMSLQELKSFSVAVKAEITTRRKEVKMAILAAKEAKRAAKIEKSTAHIAQIEAKLEKIRALRASMQNATVAQFAAKGAATLVVAKR